jgi:hypothetical protein
VNYTEFRRKSVEEFNEIQGEFRNKFKVEDYSNWYYDQVTELLTLSNEGREVNFKYIPIGTYSRETKTWLWSWNNDESIERSKDETLKIRELGEKQDYHKLKEGYFESDEYDGWELVAISNKILNGIGGYKLQIDQVEKYMVIIECIDNGTVRRTKEHLVECEVHGMKRRGFVCHHLINGDNKGFEEAFPTIKGMELEEDDDFQAWCDKCEIERLRTDGWNEESTKFADIKLVCEDCYFEIKERNRKR